jgi:hypothetical protein
MTAPRSSATDLGATFVAALTAKDFGRLAGTLAPDVRMRALIPPGIVELSGAGPAATRFATWFGESERLELVQSGTDELADRLHISYRLRVKNPGSPWKIVEQHLFCATDGGRLAALDLVCSGLRAESRPLRCAQTAGLRWLSIGREAARGGGNRRRRSA